MGSGLFTPQSPQFVQDVRQGSSFESVTETVNIAATGYVKDAAGSTVVVDLTQGPILEKYGSKIGSFWGSPQNLMYTQKVQAVSETDGAASFGAYDATTDLEKIFESSTSARYIAKLTDGAGNTLYGWIGGVAVASNVYTFSIYSEVGLSTQNWFQGGATTYSHSYGSTVQIFRYASSLVFGSTNTFTEEIPYHSPSDPSKEAETEFRFLASLTNGQYGIDYKNNRFLGRKANTDDTEVFTYRSFAGPGGTADSVNVAQWGGTATTLGQKAAASSVPVVLANDVDVEVVGNVAHDAVDSGNPVKMGGRARSSQIAAVAENDRSDLITTLNGELITAGYSYANQNNRVGETDPISTHHVEASLATVTNGANGTYYYYVDMDGYSNMGTQLVLTGTLVVTVEATVQDDGTAQASCTYVDVTTDAYGVASFAASAMLNDSLGFFGQFKYVRIKVVASGGGTDDWTIYSKRKY